MIRYDGKSIQGSKEAKILGATEQQLQKYAELAVKNGIHIQKDQVLVVQAPVEAAEFVRKVVKVAYETGAKDVVVEYNDEVNTRNKYLLAPEKTFQEFPEWRARSYEDLAKSGAGFLTVYAPNPDLLQGVEPDRISNFTKAASTALEEFTRMKTSDEVSWSIVAYPTPSWAKKVFPQASVEDAIDQLWGMIFKATRVDQADPVAAWNEHVGLLKEKLEYLNSHKIHRLHYQATGTDLSIELPKGHIWLGGGATTPNGTFFLPNIPTEEVFTLPLRGGVNGKVSSTKPLNFGGNLIDGFTLTFKDGQIVEYTAETGYETLKRMIETDEGSHYLGEIALVPHHSPISDLNTIFYNTLFDENASCHLAIGFAYPNNLEGGNRMSKDELRQNGANTSLIHVDFMMGSADMNIDAELVNGEKVAIFRKGSWAI
jgi:aminopeptidase